MSAPSTDELAAYRPSAQQAAEVEATLQSLFDALETGDAGPATIRNGPLACHALLRDARRRDELRLLDSRRAGLSDHVERDAPHRTDVGPASSW